MKKQIGIFLAGAVVVIPFAITVYVIRNIGVWLNSMGEQAIKSYWSSAELPAGVGAAVILATIYCVGLLTRFWVFRSLLGLLEKLVSRVPGVKTIYESVRDVLRLFGHDSSTMGRVVLYKPPGTGMALLGVLTNEVPIGVPQAPSHQVALYVPFSYMLGGWTIYVPAEHLEDVNLPVEEALKLCATAQVGAKVIVGSDLPAASQPRAKEKA